MSEKDLFDAVSGIGDELVLRAEKEREKQKSAGSPRRGWLAAAAALTAVFLMVAVSVPMVRFFRGNAGNLPDGTNAAGETGAPSIETGKNNIGVYTDEPVPSYEIASWYPSPTLVVRALSASGVSSAEEPSLADIPSQILLSEVTANALKNVVNASMIDVTSAIAQSEHAGHTNVYLDTASGGIVCYSCLVEQLAKPVLSAGERLVLDTPFAPGYITYAIYGETENRILSRTLLNTGTGTLTPLPVVSANDFDSFLATPDMKTILSHATRETDDLLDDVYLIDTATGTVKSIAGDLRTFLNSRFSPDGRYVFNCLRYPNGSAYGFESPNALFQAYAVESGISTVCEGRILAVRGDILVTETRDGTHTYDLSAGGEVTPGENVHVFSVRDAGFGGKPGIYILTPATGDSRFLCELPDGYLVSDDGNYLFTYRTGEAEILCYGVDSGDSFALRLSDRYAADTAAAAKDNSVFYQLFLSDDAKELLISYHTTPLPQGGPDEPTQDPDAYTGNFYDEVARKLDTGVTSIREALALCEAITDVRAASFMKNHGTTAAYKGENYFYLVVGGIAFVEDYRDGKFTAYLVNGAGTVSAPFGKEYLNNGLHRTDCSGTYDDTANFLEDRFGGFEEARVDFAQYMTGDRFDEQKMKDSFLSDAALANAGHCTVFLSGFGLETWRVDVLTEWAHEFLSSDRKEVPISRVDDCIPGFFLRVNNGAVDSYLAPDGTAYISVARETVYQVPLGVYADFQSFCYHEYVRNGYGSYNAKNPLVAKLAPMSGQDGKRLTPAELPGLRTVEDLVGYACILHYATGSEEATTFDRVCASFEVWLDPYMTSCVGNLYVEIDHTGKIIRMKLFDTGLCYCRDGLVDGLSGDADALFRKVGTLSLDGKGGEEEKPDISDIPDRPLIDIDRQAAVVTSYADEIINEWGYFSFALLGTYPEMRQAFEKSDWKLLSDTDPMKDLLRELVKGPDMLLSGATVSWEGSSEEILTAERVVYLPFGETEIALTVRPRRITETEVCDIEIVAMESREIG